MATTLQAFALSKKSFSAKSALALARRHGAIKIQEYPHEYRVRIKDPGRLRTQGFSRFRRLHAAPGIDLIVAAKGRQGNPPRGSVGMIPGEAETMFYQRHASRHPGPYQHRFGPGARMFALKNGDVVIRSMTGRKLWGKY